MQHTLIVTVTLLYRFECLVSSNDGLLKFDLESCCGRLIFQGKCSNLTCLGKMWQEIVIVVIPAKLQLHTKDVC